MVVDAELFVVADEMLVEVWSRVRQADLELVLPPLFDRSGYDQRTTLRSALQVHLGSEAAVPRVLSGQWAPEPSPAVDHTLTATALQALVVQAAATATQAASQARDAQAVLRTAEGPLSTWDFLRRLTLTRCLVAHYVAAAWFSCLSAAGGARPSAVGADRSYDADVARAGLLSRSAGAA